MSFLLIKILILVIATAIAAYTDYKTSFIFNWLSLPLISLGLISIVLESFVFKNPLGWNYFLNVLLISILIYGIGYVFYYYGKLGFGDIKLFIGINLLLPYFYGKVTILWLLILSSLSSVLIVSIKYIFILLKKISGFPKPNNSFPKIFLSFSRSKNRVIFNSPFIKAVCSLAAQFFEYTAQSGWYLFL